MADAQVIDLFQAVVDVRARAAGEAARVAATTMTATLDRHRASMPTADLAAIMSTEALAMLILDAALNNARAAIEQGCDQERAFGKFRAALGAVDDAIEAYQPDVERRLLDLMAQSA